MLGPLNRVLVARNGGHVTGDVTIGIEMGLLWAYLGLWGVQGSWDHLQDLTSNPCLWQTPRPRSSPSSKVSVGAAINTYELPLWLVGLTPFWKVVDAKALSLSWL